VVEFSDSSIATVPMDLIQIKTLGEGSVEDNAQCVVQWKVGNKKKPYEGVILFKGIAGCACRFLGKFIIFSGTTGSKDECDIVEKNEVLSSEESDVEEVEESGSKGCKKRMLPPKSKNRKGSAAPQGPKKKGRPKKVNL